MKQVLQSLKTGETLLADVPVPRVAAGALLIQTSATLVSAGTERMLVEFGKANWFEKARQQPDKVRMVLDKVRTEGLAATFDAVQSKLDQPLALGYCNVGRVTEIGDATQGFAIGDRVVSNGKHAEVVCVPKNLCAQIPSVVSDEHAAFTVVAAIGLQGIRLVNPTLGENVVVIGLGLIGLLTVQMLRAQGCKVLGIDFDPTRLALARRFGAEVVNPSAGEDVIAAADTFSRGRGVDAVIITASTKSNEPVGQAARMCRQRGRIVLVGVTGLELSRADFYEKELSFQVSCSYGPGRYDPSYEQDGNDYPVGFVRWTEQRNFEAVLELMADGRIDVAPMISHRFAIADVARAYEVVGGSEPSLGILLGFDHDESSARLLTRTVEIAQSAAVALDHRLPTISFLGAGNYATAVLIPAFKTAGARLRSVASASGVSGVHAGKKYGFEQTTTDALTLFSDYETHAVIVATRHDSHAKWVLKAAASNKHVFVEKPVALTLDEVAAIEIAFGGSNELASAPVTKPLLMVGFNRRFAPLVQKMHSLLAAVPGAKAFVMTVNAGAIPPSHWAHDLAVGGGRVLGEACHFIDLLRFLVGVEIVQATRSAARIATGDTLSLQLSFADGSIGTIHYFANGSRSYPKERLEVFASGRVLQLDNFRKLHGFGWPTFKKMSLWKQDKGQRACAAAFTSAIKNGGPSPIPLGELLEVARVSIKLATENPR